MFHCTPLGKKTRVDLSLTVLSRKMIVSCARDEPKQATRARVIRVFMGRELEVMPSFSDSVEPIGHHAVDCECCKNDCHSEPDSEEYDELAEVLFNELFHVVWIICYDGHDVHDDERFYSECCLSTG